MKILCILNNLTVPGRGERKEGLYCTLVRMHAEEVTPDVAVLAPNTRRLDTEDVISASKAMGGASIVPVVGVSINSVARYVMLAIGRDVKKFLKLIYRYRYELSAADTYIKEHGHPDVIAALQNCEDSGFLAYLIGRRHGISYIVLEHTSHYRGGSMKGKRGRIVRRIVKRVVTSAKLLLTVSPQLEESIKNTLDAKEVHCITMPNPIPESFFEKSSDSLPPKLNKFMEGKFVFAGWTNWKNIKRPDVALRAFKKVHMQAPESCLVLAGPVPDWAPKMAIDLEMSDAVLFAGSLNRQEIKLLAYNCDCGILTSDYETFGLPVTEAMAAGKPVVATRCGGPESIIIGDTYGLLVEKDNPEELAKAMLEIKKNYNTFDPAVICAYCKANYGEKVLSHKWKEVYRSLGLLNKGHE